MSPEIKRIEHSHFWLRNLFDMDSNGLSANPKTLKRDHKNFKR